MYGNRPNDVSKFIKQSLKNLQVDYLDLYLIHLPFSVTRSDENQTDYREMEMDYTTNHVEIWKVSARFFFNSLPNIFFKKIS